MKNDYPKRKYHPRNEPVDGLLVKDHPLYNTWAGILSRCFNPSEPGYKNYGGRGITVCKRWFHFRNFAKDMGEKPSHEHSIDRIDNDKGYNAENCRWATRTEQCLNRRVFKNNTSGSTGIIKKGNSWIARYDEGYNRYIIGWFKGKEEAVLARAAFIEKFKLNRQAAIASLPKDKARFTSQTNCRGINPHQDGGFTARCTLNGVRYYVGYFKNITEAVRARKEFIEKKTGRTPT